MNRDRSTTIGASEIAGLLNESPFTSRYKLWCEKTGLVDREERDPVMEARLQIGRDLEKPILEIWAKRAGFAFDHNTLSVPCKTVDGLSATPDGYVVNDVNHAAPWLARAVADAKTVRPHERKAWADGGTPRYYWWQLQGQTLCCEVTDAYLVALFGFDEIGHQLIKADKSAHQRIADEVGSFWRQVRGEIPPPEPSDDKASLDAALAIRREEKTIALDNEARKLAIQWTATKAEINRLTSIERGTKAKMIAALGDAQCGVFADGGGFKIRVEERKESITRAHRRQVLVAFAGKDAEEGDEDVE